MNPKVLLGIGGALVLVLFIVAVAVGLSNEVDPADTMPQNVAVELSGNALPPHDPSAAVDPAVGQSAPQINTVAFDETPAALAHDGTPKAILFLAHWCPHCQAEVPVLQDYINTNGLPEGVELVSIATSIDPARTNYPPSTWLEREGWTPEVLVDDAASTISQAYGLTAFPYYVFIDGNGSVVARISGGQSPEAVAGAMEQLAAQS